MALSQAEPFELKGEWWRSDGADLIEVFETAGPDAGGPAPDRGFAMAQRARDRRCGSDEEHACRGTLTYDLDSGIRLSLLGASTVVFDDSSDFVVHGRTVTGRPCSLLGCFVSHHTANMPRGISEVEITVNQLVHGVFVDAPEELCFDRAVFDIEGLREFLTAAAPDGSGTRRPGLRGDEPEDQKVMLGGATIRFRVGWQESHSVHASSSERLANVEVTLDQAIDLPSWRKRYEQPLERLVTLAAREGVRGRSFTALLSREGGDEDETEPPLLVDVVAPVKYRAREPRLRSERLLVSYAALADDFERHLARWWHVHERLGGAADFLFGALSEPMALEPRLVTIASVVEAYHRVFHDHPTVDPKVHEAAIDSMLASLESEDLSAHYRRRLRYAYELAQHERIVEVIRRAGEVVKPLGQKAGRLAETVTATRNYFVHLSSGEKSAHEGEALYELVQLLTLALFVNLLLDLGLSLEHSSALTSGSYAGEPFWNRMQVRGTAWPKPPKSSDSPPGA
jgi:hypothetical protein